MTTSIIPVRPALGSTPSSRSGNHMTRIACGGLGAVIAAGPVVVPIDTGRPDDHAWVLPGNVAFWMKKEGRG